MFKYSRFAQFCTSFTLFNLTLAGGLLLSECDAAIVVNLTPAIEQPLKAMTAPSTLIAAASSGKNSLPDSIQSVQSMQVSTTSAHHHSTTHVAASDDELVVLTNDESAISDTAQAAQAIDKSAHDADSLDADSLDITVTSLPVITSLPATTPAIVTSAESAVSTSALATSTNTSAIAIAQTNNAAAKQASASTSAIKQESTPKTYRDAFGNLMSRPIVSTLDAETDNKSGSGSSLHSNASTACALPLAASPVVSNSNDRINIAVIYFSRAEQDESAFTAEHANPAAPANPAELAELAAAFQATGTTPPILDIDVLTGASVLYDEQKQRYGLIEYLARNINKQVHGDLYQLSRYTPYPHDHDALVDEVSSEYDHHSIPQIRISPNFNPEQYDLVFIGYPIWWQDLPRPFYKFFDLFDLSGKTIIPFSSHAGNKSAKTCELIQEQEPNAKVMCEHGLILAHQDIPYSGKELVDTWLHELDTSVLSPLRQQSKQTLVLNMRSTSEDAATEPNQDNYATCSSNTTAIAPKNGTVKRTQAGGNGTKSALVI